MSSEGEDQGALEERARALHERSRPSRLSKRTHFWMRWVHVYTSMFALLVVLFFGITGLTLNHPSWTFGDDPTSETFTGTLPGSVVVGGEVELLAVSEFIRSAHDVSGEVTDFSAADGEGTIAYKAPGYGADLFFDLTTLEYSINIRQLGFVGVMNDIHKGRNANSSWRWAIDVSAVLLIVVAVTGLTIQFFMRKRRTSALSLAVAGTLLAVALIWWAMP